LGEEVTALAGAASDLCALSASEAAALLRRGDVSAERYARAHLDRCARLERLNAFLTLDRDAVLSAACEADRARAAGNRPGRLHGLPIAVKDNIDVAGMPTTCNSPQLAGNRAATDAALVRRLRAEGAIVLGKNNMHELALGSPNDADRGGNAVNPHAPGMMTGGSSSGTAVAVAARLAPAGIGTDTGGSVRIPSAHCGIAGLRPTLGRYPVAGMVALCPTRDTAGPMTRDIVDAALLDAVLGGDTTPLPTVTLKGIRLGVPRRYFYETLDPETAAFAERELTRLKEHGAALVEADIDDVERLNAAVSFIVFLYEVPRHLAAYIAERLPGISPTRFGAGIASSTCRKLVRGLLGAPDPAFPPVLEQEYRAAIETHRPALRAAYRRYFESNRVDAIVYPTTPLPARPIAQTDSVKIEGKSLSTLLTFLRLIDPSSNAGLPGITVPAGKAAGGVPLGLAFDGPEGGDRHLLAIGAAYERTMPPFPGPSLSP
jgi:mandelamide amidase